MPLLRKKKRSIIAATWCGGGGGGGLSRYGVARLLLLATCGALFVWKAYESLATYLREETATKVELANMWLGSGGGNGERIVQVPSIAVCSTATEVGVTSPCVL